MQEYVSSSVYRSNKVAAIWVYTVDNSTTVPPPANDTLWNLNGTNSWLSNIPLPVVALSSSLGLSIMAQLTEQSMVGAVPNSLNQTTDPWLFAGFDQPSSTGNLAVVPDLWTIVLAVLAAFVAVLAIISGVLHLLQSRRRRDLRRRIAAGQVDLSILGVRKLTVPQDVLDTLPIKPHSEVSQSASAQAEPAPVATATEPSAVLAEKGAPTATTTPTTATDTAPAASTSTSASSSAPPTHSGIYNQPTCAICIDDFEPDTPVRLLPCNHIFHTACIDPFFLETSSLCPMCKKSVLPKGYCPAKITNSMVRRERIANLQDQDGTVDVQSRSRIARLGIPIRSRGAPSAATPDSPQTPMHRLRGALVRPARTHGPGEPAPAPASVELRDTTTPAAPGAPLSIPPHEQACPSHATPQGRREWARRRALQLLGQSRAAHDPAADALEAMEEERQRRRPWWRKAVAVVFPGRDA